MTELVAWVGDGLVPVERATVSVFDRAFRGGEGVFETLRAYGRHVFRLERHLDRAYEGARVLGFTPPPRQIVAAAVLATVDANAGVLPDGGAVRLTITPGALDPTTSFPGRPDERALVVVTIQPVADNATMWRNGVSAVSVPWGREVPSVKAVSYVASSLARRRARDAGADEALFLDEAHDVLEASTANVFAVVGTDLVTPPVEAGLLPGVTRQAVLDVAAEVGLHVRERRLPLATLLAADEAFLTASTREVVPLVLVDGNPVGSGAAGPVTAAVHAAYRRLVAAEAAPPSV